MPRKLKAEEAHLWGHVTATVRPLPGRAAPKAMLPPVEGAPAHLPVPKAPAAGTPRPARPPEAIEPGRHKRIVRGLGPLEARIDLHGMTHDRARSALESYLLRVWDEGFREVLVITGKGTQGDGVLRRFTPEWLAAAPLRAIVAGVSQAHRRHGGEGALYVALKRKARA
ncbi:MAG: Smr/MutS family protein [Caulobacterales bacterium]|nr:Smr/MutS family protein [Caulobacterales bacterium]